MATYTLRWSKCTCTRTDTALRHWRCAVIPRNPQNDPGISASEAWAWTRGCGGSPFRYFTNMCLRSAGLPRRFHSIGPSCNLSRARRVDSMKGPSRELREDGEAILCEHFDFPYVRRAACWSTAWLFIARLSRSALPRLWGFWKERTA
jgi:hypothetical protein